MDTLNSLQDLEGLVVNEEESTILPDRSQYRKHSKTIAAAVGYLLGVREDFLKLILEDETLYAQQRERWLANPSAAAIRSLNNIRSNLMLHFKEVTRDMRVTSANYRPLYKMEYFEEDFKALERLEIRIYISNADVNDYLRRINAEIGKRIDAVRGLFPDWVDFRHIRLMFNMPQPVEEESKKFQTHQNCYPYKRYFYWIYPEELGNILITDNKLLQVVYYNAGDVFLDENRVIDASDHVKNTISEFIQRGEKIQIFVDGENVDPYSFAAAIYDLKEHEIEKIDKIVVYYDDVYSSRAWLMLKHFTFDIDVEAIPVSRIKEEKSLVDHKLVAGISKAFYRDGVTSFILASSDSDFWAVMEDVEANYLVMVEREKCGTDFKEVLRKNNIFYCYMDKFQIPQEDRFFKTVFRKELESVIERTYPVCRAKALLDEALSQSYAEVSEGVYESLYNRYIKGLHLTLDKDGALRVTIPE